MSDSAPFWKKLTYSISSYLGDEFDQSTLWKGMEIPQWNSFEQ
jgi:hypothetical protein